MHTAYILKRNEREAGKWDVIRNEPTVVSSALKYAEAEALAHALNVQLDQLENAK